MEKVGKQEGKKAALAKLLNVDKEYIEKTGDLTYKVESPVYSNDSGFNFCVLTTSERKALSMIYIKNNALTNEWNYGIEELLCLLEISRDDFENMILPDLLCNPSIIYEGRIDGDSLNIIVEKTVGKKEFEERLFKFFDYMGTIPSLLARYDQKEDVIDGYYIYKVL